MYYNELKSKTALEKIICCDPVKLCGCNTAPHKILEKVGPVIVHNPAYSVFCVLLTIYGKYLEVKEGE